jgi:acetyl esterase/lipase
MLTSLRNKAFAALIRYQAGLELETHEDEVLHIPSRDADRKIKVHVYRAKNAAKPVPVLLNFHGSGFVVPLHGEDDPFCLQMRDQAGVTVLDVSYRLAPENPYPAAPDDVEDAANWVLDHPEEFDSSRISLSGFSAGGNLALGLSGCSLPGKFRHVIAFYPPTDISRSRHGLNAAPPDDSGQLVPAWVSAGYNDCYAPPPIDRKHPRVSPLFAEPEQFPDSVIVVTCARDGLCNEAEELVRKIQVSDCHFYWSSHDLANFSNRHTSQTWQERKCSCSLTLLIV